MIILRIVQIFITWLLIVSLVSLVTKRLKFPYTVGLVVVGLILALIALPLRDRSALISLDEIQSILVPNLILTILVPPLVFEAAFNVRWDELRPSLKTILLYAIPGIALSMLMVGFVISVGAKIALPVAFAFGALISATDPVAVVAIFRSLGAPKQLLTLLEGESLFNDGTAIVLFHTMLGVAAAGQFKPLASILEFLVVALGGALAGGLIGLLTTVIFFKLNDHLIEISLSLVVAYGSYLLAEHFHLSGVLAVVAAGLVLGNVRVKALSEYSRRKLIDFWEYAVFLANSFIFLIIGLTIKIELILNNIGYILLAILAVLVARAIVIYGLSRLSKQITSPYMHVLFWGGLRGAISLALALSLTIEEVGQDIERLQAMAFGVVLFTLLVQGTTMGWMLKRFGLVKNPEIQ